MTSFTRQKILEKLESFSVYLDYLHQLKREAGNEAGFLADFHLFGNAERYLQLAIQIIIDVSHLIIIDFNLEKPDDNYEAISIIAAKKIVSPNLAQKLTKMVGLRNILVHGYGKIDRKIIYVILKNQIKDLADFRKSVINFLKR